MTSYDSARRLATASGPWGSGAITYRGLHDLATVTLGVVTTTYAYDNGTNRLAGTTGGRVRSYGYDGYGSVTSDGARSYRYDDAQALVCGNCGRSDEVVYQYDGDGVRVAATPRGAATTYFVYARSGELLWEQTPGQALKE